MKNRMNGKKEILTGVYLASWGTSMLVLGVVAALEVFMLVYSVVNSPMYGVYLWKYRTFYIILLSLTLIYIAIASFVKKDMAHRYRLLSIANPIYAAMFFAWSLGITWSDVMITGTADPAVFMTLSLVIPLGFYLSQFTYALIAAAADVIMVVITISVQGYIGVLINLSIFIVFQFVLGMSFLHLREKLTERIIREEKNAKIDVLTGFPNRRAYVEDMEKLMKGSIPEDLVYIAIDLNELKVVNDHYGHEAGDHLIIGAAECMQKCFGRGKLYRIGGDEFVVQIRVKPEELEQLFADYEECMKTWSEQNTFRLSTAYGTVRFSEHKDNFTELVRVADERMYEAKNRYYRENGIDRRRIASPGTC